MHRKRKTQEDDYPQDKDRGLGEVQSPSPIHTLILAFSISNAKMINFQVSHPVKCCPFLQQPREVKKTLMDGVVTLNKQLLSGVLPCETVSCILGRTDDKHDLGLLILQPPNLASLAYPLLCGSGTRG